jgi:small basic protein
MRRIGTLVTGIVIGLVVQSAVAQKRTEAYVNYVGIAVPSVPGAPSAFSHARLANVTDPNGIRIELAELTPESLQRKAIDSWK